MQSFFLPKVGGGADGRIPTYIVGSSTWNGYADYKCDGTDDQVEIQQAIDDAYNNGLYGIIYLTPGQFNITNTIDVKDFITLLGSGPTSTWLWAQADVDIVKLDGYGASVSNLLIYGYPGSFNKSVYVNRTRNSVVSNLLIFRMGIFADTARFISIYGCTIRDPTIHGILLYNTQDSIVYNNTINHAVQDAILFNSGSGLTAIGNVVSGAYTGIRSTTPNSTIFGNSIRGATYAGIEVAAASNIVTSNVIDSSNRGIHLNSPNSQATNNYITRCTVGILADNNYPTITGNVVENSDQYGIWVDTNGDNAVVTGNHIIGASASGVGLYPALRIYDVKYCTVTGNVIQTTDIGIYNYAIQEESSPDYNTYTGNTLVKGTAGYVNLTGAHDITSANILR